MNALSSAGSSFKRHPGDSSLNPVFPGPELACIARVGIGMAVLLIGSAAPDERLALSGIPLSPVIFFIAAIWVAFLPCTWATFSKMAILQFPLMPLGLSLFWSPDVSYGAEKFFNLLLSVNIAVIALASAMQQWGWRAVCQSLLIFLSALLLGALGYKLQFGFLDRYVPFLMFGPITFARLMGIGLVISLFLVRGVSRLLLVGLFGLAVIWTTSKGPILSALVVVLMWIIFDAKRPAENFSRLLGFAAITAAAVFLILQSGLDITKLGRLGALLTVSGEDVIRQGSTDSISIRYWLGIYSLQLIADQPMGVGLGGWATSVAQNFSLIYPHNLMLELWSEGGLLAGSFALLGFCGFLFAPSSIWKYVALFLLLAQMFSGDLLDGRYLLIFGLLSFFHTDSGLKRVRRVPEVINS